MKRFNAIVETPTRKGKEPFKPKVIETNNKPNRILEEALLNITNIQQNSFSH